MTASDAAASQPDLTRFIDAQNPVYDDLVTELRSGRKRTHWMWFIFPQLAGLGHSAMSRHFAIHDLADAERYLTHPILGARLVECARILLQLEGRTAHDIFGSPDDVKLRSSMTLFAAVRNAPGVFADVLQKYFGAARDARTLELLREG
jgi:uncharacterized protein (DUF1810 family)